MKSNQTKATDIKPQTKKIVWERDHHRCILCWNPNAQPCAHFISRAHGGLGIEQNIVTLCDECHRKFDQSVDRKIIATLIEEYLKKKYPNWDKESLVYHK